MIKLSPHDVRRARQRMGMTQSELASALGLSGSGRDTVRCWEMDADLPKHRDITGPATLALLALLDDWIPISREKFERIVG